METILVFKVQYSYYINIQHSLTLNLGLDGIMKIKMFLVYFLLLFLLLTFYTWIIHKESEYYQTFL